MSVCTAEAHEVGGGGFKGNRVLQSGGVAADDNLSFWKITVGNFSLKHQSDFDLGRKWMPAEHRDIQFTISNIPAQPSNPGFLLEPSSTDCLNCEKNNFFEAKRKFCSHLIGCGMIPPHNKDPHILLDFFFSQGRSVYLLFVRWL